MRAEEEKFREAAAENEQKKAYEAAKNVSPIS